MCDFLTGKNDFQSERESDDMRHRLRSKISTSSLFFEKECSSSRRSVGLSISERKIRRFIRKQRSRQSSIMSADYRQFTQFSAKEYDRKETDFRHLYGSSIVGYRRWFYNLQNEVGSVKNSTRDVE